MGESKLYKGGAGGEDAPKSKTVQNSKAVLGAPDRDGALFFLFTITTFVVLYMSILGHTDMDPRAVASLVAFGPIAFG